MPQSQTYTSSLGLGSGLVRQARPLALLAHDQLIAGVVVHLSAVCAFNVHVPSTYTDNHISFKFNLNFNFNF